MIRSDPRLAERRATLKRARAEFRHRLGRAKVDLAPAELKRRVTAEAQRTALSAAHQAMEIAGDSRGVVAATAAALMLWVARKPIFAGANALLDRFTMRKSVPERIGDRIKLVTANAWRRLKEYADE
ncbi:MAG: hypothetical protein M3N34_06835 [Pseudomonadota bacterium]|nr:hypothetical protein [Pseudomonadota bacterium]